MKYILLISMYFCLSFSFSQNKDNELRIITLKQYELDSHKNFQKNLYNFSDNYIKQQSEKFIDDETGFFSIVNEIIHWGDSKVKRSVRWKSRIEKYFRPTDYAMSIKKEQDDYAKIINLQREKVLGSLHIKKNKLKLKNRDIDMSVSVDIIEEVINKINNLILVEIIPEVIEAFLVRVLLVLLVGFLGVFTIKATKGVIFILSLIGSIYYGGKFSNELENRIYKEFEISEKRHLNVLSDLNENTKKYYIELQKYYK